MDWSEISTQLLAGISATLSALSTGFHIGWPAPSLPKLLSDDSDVTITSSESSWVVGIFTAATALGALLTTVTVDRCGRRVTLLITMIPQLISCVLIGIAQNFWWLLIARFVAGVATGTILTVLPMYLGEIANDRIRGALVIFVSIMLNLGILVTYFVGPWVSRPALAGLGAAFVLFFGATFIWMPESPHFLVMKGKLDQAEKSILWFRGEEHAELELIQVQQNVEFDLKNAGTVNELIMVPGNRKPLLIVVGVAAAQQLSGIGAILAYSTIIFEASGSTIDSNISVIIIGSVQLLSGVLTLFAVDLAGRRPLLMFSAVGSALFLGGEALYFQLQANRLNVNAISWLPLTAMIGCIVCYAAGFASIPYVLLSEMFPYNVKRLATMAVALAMAASGFVIAIAYQAIADDYGIHIAFWGFMGITIIAAISIYLTLPETKQKSLLNIQAELHKTTASCTPR